MSVVGASFVVMCFALLAHYIGLFRWTNEVMGQVKESMAVLSNSQLDDLAKEKAMQSSAIKLFKLLGLLLVGSVVAVLLPFAIIWVFDAMGWISFDSVINMLMRWDFLLAATVIGFAIFFMLRRSHK